MKENDLVGLLIDENELIKDGYKVVYATAAYKEQYNIIIDGKKFTTKWENYLSSLHGIISEDDFNDIGEYIFIEGCIPIKYVNSYEEWH
ncbi:hypothetical protein J8Y16_04785 [Bacillus cereus]|uniref:hypothetical protein n=1 Tax=Bacillus cereus TaxID=1396 RepID=UPI001BB3E0B1|nr:hypothetical protein [Bacillus cereus]QUW27445.1 hypothetical protein J8Y16_04785 [Bacillus cereus]